MFGPTTKAGGISLSVVVSVRDNAVDLNGVLRAVRASDLPRASYEIIVVDDASSDGSVAIAARYADKVIKLTGRESGPAYARNRGVEVARGEIVAFVDGDVMVSRETLPRILDILRERPDVDAVSASHCEQAGASNFLSSYWNLLVCFGERRHSLQGSQFAAGCGAVRREAFLAAGMYDEWRFPTSSLESVELGERLRGVERGVLLTRDLTVTHLKRWHFTSICREVWNRCRLLSRSLGYIRMSASAPGDVVFTLSRSLIPAVAGLATLSLAAAFVPQPVGGTRMALGVLALVLTSMPVHRYYANSRGFGFAIASIPVHICVQLVAAAALCTGWFLRGAFGDVSRDATTQAYSEVGLELWPPVPRRS